MESAAGLALARATRTWTAAVAQLLACPCESHVQAAHDAMEARRAAELAFVARRRAVTGE